MDATIRRYDRVVQSRGDIQRAGRQLGAVVSAIPGFVSYVLVETADGAVASITIFETAADLAMGDQLLATWEAEHVAPPTPVAAATTGEILIQCGL